MSDLSAALSSYELRHAIPHLLAADATQDVHDLLILTDTGGANVWFAIKESHGDGAGYTENLREAWSRAQSDLKRNTENDGLRPLERVFLYSAILSTLNSFAGRVPGGVLARLMKTGLWHWREAFSYAQRVPDPVNRASALASVYSGLPLTARAEAHVYMRQAVDEIRLAGNASGRLLADLASVALTTAEGFQKALDSSALVTLARDCQSWSSSHEIARRRG